MASSFFITGTDTEIGKTFVTSSLAHTLKTLHPNWQITPRKPIASGAIWQDGELVSEDALHLHSASQSDETLEQICPHLFEAAISPERAIRQAGLSLTIDDMLKASEVTDGNVTLVEGAGGFYSPLALDGRNAELAIKLGHPVILVVGNRLGCINHALLSIEAIQQQGLALALVVINDIHPDSDKDNMIDLQTRLDALNIAHYHVPFQSKNTEKQPKNHQAWLFLDGIETKLAPFLQD